MADNGSRLDSYIDDYWFLISLFGAANFSFMKVTTFVTIVPVCATSAGVVCRYVPSHGLLKGHFRKKAELLIRPHWSLNVLKGAIF